MQEDEEHNKLEEEIPKDRKTERENSKSHGDSKLKKLERSHGEPKTQIIIIDS